MSDTDTTNPPDPDDWFSEPDVLEPARDQPATATSTATESAGIDDWLGESAAPQTRRRRAPSSVDPRVVILVAIGLVVLLIVGLAVGGVFSSSSSKPQPPLYTITTHTTTTQTTTTTTSSVPAPTTTLKPGDTGHQVTVLQLALAHLGYSVGKVDGVYGPATEQAVKSFQTAHGLTADGICGPKTIEALKKALS